MYSLREAGEEQLSTALLKIAAAPDLQTSLAEVTEEARHIIGAHQSVTSLTVGPDWSQAITAISLSDKYQAYRDYDEKPDGSGIYSLVCSLNRPMRMTQADLEAHPAWRGFGKSAGKHPPMRGWLAVPLVARDGTNLGLIQISDKYDGGEFTDGDEALLLKLARLAAIAIERTKVVEALEASLAELRQSEERIRHLAQRQVTIREDERKRLGFDLHDNVCQDLAGVGILIESVRRSIATTLPESIDELTRAARLVSDVVEHLRLLARELRPLVLLDLGLEQALATLATGASSTATLVRAVFATAIPRLSEETEIAVYRIAQEAVSNALRHAAARGVTMTLGVESGTLRLEVRDDGCGFDTAGSGEALGLVGMQQRALASRGRLAVTSSPGAGTTIVFECPAR